MAQAYTESLLNYGSVTDSHSYGLYRVLILKTQTYTKSFLKDGSPPNGSDSLYRVFSLTVNS